MIILSIFIYLLYLDFCIFINLFSSDRFKIRCFFNWEYSVDGEENMQCMMEDVPTNWMSVKISCIVIHFTKRVLRCGK